jgi:hypothetical protein
MMEDHSQAHSRHKTTVPGLRAWQVGEYKVLDVLGEALHWLEVGLAALSVAFVGVGVFFLLAELLHFGDTLRETTLNTSFEEVLSDILLLVVGVELALMLVRRTPDSLIEVMFFVVARKMLIKADTFWDLLIGVAALAGLFAIRKYLELSSDRIKLRFPGREREQEASPEAAGD